MNNDSLLFPFDMPGDELFDSNNDGELTGLETALRDATIIECFGEDDFEVEDFDDFSDCDFD